MTQKRVVQQVCEDGSPEAERGHQALGAQNKGSNESVQEQEKYGDVAGRKQLRNESQPYSILEGISQSM